MSSQAVTELPVALYRGADVRELDRRAIEEQGIAGYSLMTKAGEAAFAILRQRWPQACRIAVCCGIGNNAGDGYVVARLANHAGLEVSLLAVADPATLKGDAARARDDALAAGLTAHAFDPAALANCDVVVDALFGTGLDRPLSGEFLAAVQTVNQSGRSVLALDIPSGLHADTGGVWGDAIIAEATVSFIGLKAGLFTGEGPSYVGKVYFDDLAVPRNIYDGIAPLGQRLEYAMVRDFLRSRPRAAHKGSFGHVLVVGGGLGMSGAVRMAAEAAARIGAGLVSVATHPQHAATVNIGRPELMVHGVVDGLALRDLLPRANCIVVGPGLGVTAWGNELLGAALESSLPMVVDADGLNLLAKEPLRRDNWVLTPHPGEAARLLVCRTAEINQDRFATARQLVKKRGGVVVLKGAGSLVCHDADGPVDVCTEGNPGMASGGMGDVLSGIIGGLIAQGFSPSEAACIGVCFHGEAGDLAAIDGERGMLASDLFPHLRRLANPGL